LLDGIDFGWIHDGGSRLLGIFLQFPVPPVAGIRLFHAALQRIPARKVFATVT
jgi:hypothetical protein